MDKKIMVGGILGFIIFLLYWLPVTIWSFIFRPSKKMILKHKPAKIINSYLKGGHSHIIVEAGYAESISRELNIPSGALIIKMKNGQYDIDLDANGSMNE